MATIVGLTSYSAFDLNIYTDKDFNTEFYSSGETKFFEVNKIGSVGLTSDAKLNLSVTKNLPDILYYKFTPVNLSVISKEKNEIVIDKEVDGNNQINVNDSIYSGVFKVTGIGSTTTFNYNLIEAPEKSSYSSVESKVGKVCNSRAEQAFAF